jgi:hypothetical protein
MKSGIRDNRTRGKVAECLKEINANSAVFLSAWTWPVLLGLKVGQLQAGVQAMKQY